MPFVTYYKKTISQNNTCMSGHSRSIHEVLRYTDLFLTYNYFCHAVTSQRDRNRYTIFIVMTEIFLRSNSMVILKYLLSL